MHGRRLPPQLATGVIAVVLCVWAMRASRAVLEPFVLAFFAALLFKPLIDWFNRRAPQWVGLAVSTTLLLLAFLAVGWFLGFSASAVSDRADFYIERLGERVTQLKALWHAAPFSRNPNGAVDAQDVVQLVTSWLQSAMWILGQVVIFLFLYVFFVIEFRGFHRKLVFGFSPDFSAAALRSFDEISIRFQRFVRAQTFVSILTGVLTTGVTFAMGVDFPLLWGAIAFLLNYIPNIGSIIAVIPPVLVAFLQFDDIIRPLVLLGALGLVQNAVGNYLAPRMLGRSVALSPLVVFVAMIFWGWLWGPVGFILSVPLTVAIRIICEHNDALRPISVMLGDATELPELELPPRETRAQRRERKQRRRAVAEAAATAAARDEAAPPG